MHQYSEADRQKLAHAHVEAQNKRYQGDAGGGLVTAHVNGLQELVAVHLSPQALRGDPRALEDLIVKAVSAANKQSARALYEQMRGVQDALGIEFSNLPGPAQK